MLDDPGIKNVLFLEIINKYKQSLLETNKIDYKKLLLNK